MYFFLCNLAFIDLCFVNTTVPNLLKDITRERKKISVAGCLAQSYLYFLVGTTQFFLLDVMCYDRYLAICHPLYYSAIMRKKMCVQLVLGAWLSSFFCILFPTLMTMRLSFCFSKINHFFCDIGPLLRNSCSDSSFVQLLVFLSSGSLLFSLMVAVISYTHIVLAISKIRSAEGRSRVFSTCSSHAIVVSFFFGSCIFMYIKPVRYQAVDEYDKLVAVLNTIIVPLINPYIYTLRNKIVNDILRGRRGKCITISKCIFHFRNTKKHIFQTYYLEKCLNEMSYVRTILH
ncbi:unnamed protein product [Staurois parvus]|uniref:G-protein coupled receptors family 1 profile domain-containing protein n=1 Tax=Staurois parvus TaxID=386267 RepID=A0ABN9GB51_9NEOB|nr:unnamed protein product [Staurois parvus]